MKKILYQWMRRVYKFGVFSLIYLLGLLQMSCEDARTVELGNLKIRLAEYFNIQYETNPFGGISMWLEVPAIAYTPDGQFDARVYIFCRSRSVRIECNPTERLCNKYAKKNSYILFETKSFSFESIWYNYCTSAGK